MRKEKENKYVFMISAGILFLGFLVGCVVLIHAMRGRSEERLDVHLLDAVDQRQVALRHKIEGNFQTLRAIGSGIAFPAPDELSAFLVRTFEGNSFRMIGFTDLAGKVTALERNGSHVSGVRHADFAFPKKPPDEEYFSIHVPRSNEEETVGLYAVPVPSRDGGQKGTVWAVEDGPVIKDILSVPVLRGTGYFALVDASGDFVLPPSPSLHPGANFFDVAELSPEEEKRVAGMFKEGTEGNFAFSIDGARQIAAAEPLWLNGWFIVGCVGYDTVLSSYQIFTKAAALLIVLACTLFLSLMYRQIQEASKRQAILRHVAFTDSLTGGDNYKMFRINVRRILDKNPEAHYAIWTFDTKEFNRINNIVGREKGDAALQRIFSVLGTNASEDSAYCRMSSDIFAGIRPYREQTEVADWFWSVIDTLAQRVVIPHRQLHIDDAMGVYCIDDFEPGVPIDDMVKRADLARRVAKANVGSSIVFFDVDMEQRQRWLSKLEAEGAGALKNGEITFFLQPKISIQDQYVIEGAEALVRWNHHVHGWIMPGDFIPLFENNGFIVKLDRFVFEQVCRWIKEVSPKISSRFRVSVNVSRQGLFVDDFLRYYAGIKDKYGIGDNVLELEFTESVLLDDNERFREAVSALREEGFLCSIDDFGAGYSSLNVLKNLPVDLLKLDAQFFSEEGEPGRARIIINHFLRMANELNILTVAEGVETPDQVNFLHDNGCNLVQGYVFSKPLPQDDFILKLEEHGGRVYL